MPAPSPKAIIKLLTEAVADALAAEDPRLPPLDPQLDFLLLQLRNYVDYGELPANNALVTWLQSIEAIADNPQGWVDDASNWVNALTGLGNLVGLPSSLTVDVILTRLVHRNFPRLAFVLNYIGVIEFALGDLDNGTPVFPHAAMNWGMFFAFLTDPTVIFTKEFFEQYYGATTFNARALATTLAAFLSAPLVPIGFFSGQLGLAPLEPPPVRDPLDTIWQGFRDATSNWVALTIPIPKETDDDRLSALNSAWERRLYHAYPDMQPKYSLTVAIRAYADDSDPTNIEKNFEIWASVHTGPISLEEFASAEFLLTEDWALRIRPLLTAAGGVAIGIGAGIGEPGSWVWRLPTVHGGIGLETSVQIVRPDLVELEVTRVQPAGEPAILIGPTNGSRLEIGNFGLYLRLRAASPYFVLGAFLRDAAAVVSTRFLSIFGDNLFSQTSGLRFTLDVDAAYHQGLGFRVQGTAGVQVQNEPAAPVQPLATANGAGNPTPLLGIDQTFVLDKQLGSDAFNLTIDHIRVRLEGCMSGDSLDARALLLFSASTQLGPLFATLDEGGAWIGRWTNGDVDYFGLVPPSGIAISIDAEGIVGGGFIQRVGEDHYRGALQLKIQEFSVVAFGIYEKTATGRTSVVIVLGVRFPGVQIGLGFTLNGIGGLIGINRRANVDLMRQRLVTGASGNVLFSENPVRDAPTILGDLGRFFPAVDGVYTLGPTVQLEWLEIVRFDLGIFIELPGPSRIILMGTARAEVQGVSPNKPLVTIRLDIVGVIDFELALIAFDATLINSKVLGILTLTGDAAFRLSWGARPYMLLSIGGFHPAFNPQPVNFPVLARATAAYESTGSTKIWLRQAMYFAFTSNTLQLGGLTEAGFKIGSIRGEGFYSFDVLIQFTPFYFQFDFAAGFSIKYKSRTLASIRVEGSVSGPGPVVIKVKFSFKILFVKIKESKTFKLGSEGGDRARLPDIAGAMQSALANPANLEALGGDDRLVIYAERRQVTAAVLVSPLGRIAWTQKSTPLNVSLERFEGAPLPSPHRLTVTSSSGGDSARDWFSPGSYLSLDNSESLNNDAFQYLDAGVVLSSGAPTRSAAVNVQSEINVILIPEWNRLNALATPYASAGLQVAMGERDGPTTVTAGPPVVSVSETAWTAYDAGGQPIESGLSAIEAFQQVRLAGRRGMAVPAREDTIDVTGI